MKTGPIAVARTEVFNCRLITARKTNGYTQKGLSALTGIPVRNLRRYERLASNPTAEDMDRLSSALCSDAEYLFPGILIEAVREGFSSYSGDEREISERRLDSFLEGRRKGYIGYMTKPVEIL